jgi:hypothetical protein
MTDATPRSELLRLVIGVFVIDLLAIGAYVFGGIGAASSRTRIVFAAVWTFATLVVVLIGLRRLREARVHSMRRPAPR